MAQQSVYRIDRVDAKGNSHGINRDEIWSIVLDQTFPTEKDARDYVITMNRKHCTYDLSIQYSENDEFIAERCTSPHWCHRQRYFIGRPDINRIRAQLQADGVTVLSANKQ